jgi:hypothetical protein
MDNTNAERQRRYIAKLKAKAAGSVSNGAKILSLREDSYTLAPNCGDQWFVYGDVEVGPFDSKEAANRWVAAQEKMSPQVAGADIVARDKRIAELEATLAHERAEKTRHLGKPPPPLPRMKEELEAHRRALEEQKRQEREKRKAARAAAGAKRIAEAQIDPNDITAVRDELAKALTQLAGARTQIRNLKQAAHYSSLTASERVQLVMPRRLYKHILAALHPDRAPKNAEKTWTTRMQDFAALNVEFTDEY